MRRLLAALIASFVWTASAPASASQLSGKYRVARIELSYAVDSKQSRARLALNTGESVDLDLGDPDLVDRVLAIAQIVGRGGRAYAAFEEGKLRALFVVVGQPGE